MRNLLERSLWTGIEAGLGLLSIEALTSLDASTMEVLLVAAAAMVITALKVLSTGRLSQLEEIIRPADQGE